MMKLRWMAWKQIMKRILKPQTRKLYNRTYLQIQTFFFAFPPGVETTKEEMMDWKRFVSDLGMKASSDLIADTKTTKAYESGQVTIYESEPTTTPFWSGSRRVERALASNFRA